MTVKTLLEKAAKYEIEPYKKIRNLPATHVPFTGAPQKHSLDKEKLILVVDPFSSNTFYYEFAMADIEHAERLPSLVNTEGDSVTMVRIWVRKGSLSVRCTPFVVEDTRRRLKDAGIPHGWLIKEDNSL